MIGISLCIWVYIKQPSDNSPNEAYAGGLKRSVDERVVTPSHSGSPWWDPDATIIAPGKGKTYGPI
jgi:hypothetical protein